MKTWSQIKLTYKQFLEERNLKQPNRRLSALHKIEECLRASYPSFFKGHALFTQVNKSEMKERYEHWKGRNINVAESQVINDFYKLADVSPAK